MASDPPNLKKYGVPLYGASWLPIKPKTITTDETTAGYSPETFNHLVLAGGGGEGNSGIRNEILLTRFDFATSSLSDRPIVRFGTDDDLPYRMAIHPRGDGLIISFEKTCRWYDWDMPDDNEDGKLGVKSSNRILTPLEDVGQQLALAFSEDGSLLAVGGEDGKLRVFKWPSLEILLNEENAYTEVKDLHFSADGKYLVTLGKGGPCRIWDVTASNVIASLKEENGEAFGFCRFSQNKDGDQVLYTTGRGGTIILWNTSSWTRMASKLILRDSVTAFNVSVDGKLLAIGTIDGDIKVVDSSKMRVQMIVKKAHLGFVTTLTFSRDSRALGSVSMDSSVRVTTIEKQKADGFNYWIILLIILLAVVVYFLKSKGMISDHMPFV